jgi:predicted acetyltransferase
MTEIEIRRVADDEYAAVLAASAIPFSFDPDESLAPLEAMFPTDRMAVGDDNGQIVGTSAVHAYRVTVPGGAVVAAAGVSFVTVLPTHRRMGVLRGMMQQLLEDAVEQDEPLAALWATEGGIYGRFGFGPAVEMVRQRLDSSKAVLVPGDDPDGRVRIVDRDHAMTTFGSIHSEVAHWRHGTLHRDDPFAEYNLFDAPWDRNGFTKLRYAVYEGSDGRGYVTFRTKQASPGTVRFDEMYVTSSAARRALLRFGLGFDLCRDLVLWGRPADDPIRWMLADPYAMKSENFDYVWFRLVDLKAALIARRYDVDGSIIVGVIDEQLKANGGNWSIVVSDGVATVDRTDAAPEITLTADVLAALYMGGRRLSSIVEPDSVGASEEAIARLDRMFRTTIVPWTSEEF